METTRRTLIKTLTWQTMGIVSMTLLSLPHTGSFAEALTLAASASATGFVCFFLHETVWNRIGWGRRSNMEKAAR